MELAASIFPYICPTAPFLEPENYGFWHGEDGSNSTHDLSDTTPKNEVQTGHSTASEILGDQNSGSDRQSCNRRPWITWRIDGCTSKGTQFFAAPILNRPGGGGRILSLKRIDVHIPDQTQHPPVLRSLLRTTYAVYMLGTSAQSLPIAKYIEKVLSNWSAQIDDYEALHLALPFGSKLLIPNLCENPQEAPVRVLPTSDSEDLLIGPDELQTMWPNLQLPPRLHIHRLILDRQLTDTVSLVRISDSQNTSQYIFKSRLQQPEYLYHELKMLLSIESHPHICKKPQYIVVGERCSTGTTGVFGFIIRFYPGGNLGQVIDLRRQAGMLSFRAQLKWAKQLTAALQAIRDSPVRYYSELKPDNIMCDEHGDLVLIDLEQSGNWDTYTAPEIRHVRNASRLSQSKHISGHGRSRFRAMLRPHVLRSSSEGTRYSNPPSGYFDEWNLLRPAQQEAAMVYSLGKALWSIFEGWSHTMNGMDEEYPDGCECGWEFPAFRRSSPAIQRLIQDCTQGCAFWGPLRRCGIARVGPRIYPLVRHTETSCEVHTEATAQETLLFAKDMWSQRVDDMERYLHAKERWQAGQSLAGDQDLLGFELRPTLDYVMTALNAIKTD